MRTTLSVLAHVAVAALPFACGELFLTDDVPAEPPTVLAAPADTLPVLSVQAAPDDPPSVAELENVDRRVDELMVAIQKNDRNVEAMRALAVLYAAHGWFDAAIGPLARAVELEPGRDDLRHQLDLVLGLSGGTEPVDLDEEARAFVESVEMWGHGC